MPIAITLLLASTIHTMKTSYLVHRLPLLAVVGVAVLLYPSDAFSAPRKQLTSVTPRIHSNHRKQYPQQSILHATNDNESSNSTSSSSTSNSNSRNGAYSGLPNSWGYSRSVVNDRERRRYERRRINHRLKLEGVLEGKRPPTWAGVVKNGGGDESSFGAADAFVGNVRKGKGRESGVVSATFDDDEMDEDGYWNSECAVMIYGCVWKSLF